MSETESVLAQLMAVVVDRKRNPPKRSYTTSLFAGGVPKIADKILEEAAEVVEAAGETSVAADSRAHLVHEAGDLIFHLWVMLAYHDIPLEEVENELRRRFGVSGLDEKANRSQA